MHFQFFNKKNGRYLPFLSTWKNFPVLIPLHIFFHSHLHFSRDRLAQLEENATRPHVCKITILFTALENSGQPRQRVACVITLLVINAPFIFLTFRTLVLYSIERCMLHNIVRNFSRVYINHARPNSLTCSVKSVCTKKIYLL